MLVAFGGEGIYKRRLRGKFAREEKEGMGNRGLGLGT